MLPDRVSNPGPLTYESGALPIALCGPARTRLCELCKAAIAGLYTQKSKAPKLDDLKW